MKCEKKFRIAFACALRHSLMLLLAPWEAQLAAALAHGLLPIPGVFSGLQQSWRGPGGTEKGNAQSEGRVRWDIAKKFYPVRVGRPEQLWLPYPWKCLSGVLRTPWSSGTSPCPWQGME